MEKCVKNKLHAAIDKSDFKKVKLLVESIQDSSACCGFNALQRAVLVDRENRSLDSHKIIRLLHRKGARL